MADDLGFNDISLHGSEIPTPNIDSLGIHGIILNRFYTPPMCTPSRASAFSGKYPTHVGMQHWVIDSDEPWGMNLADKVLPEFFQEAGYTTHLIGKWHLGFYKKAYTPNERGFDSFFGYLGPYIGYYNHMLQKFDRINYAEGYDMRKNYSLSYETNGTYATELFTNFAVKTINDYDPKLGKPLFLMLNHLAPHAANFNKPLEAPPEKLDQFKYILDEQRRYMAAMVSVIDDGIGDLIESLESKGILDNTIILFYSDNGAPTVGLHANKGSNYPFKGQKNSPWEGGSRVPAVIWHSKLKNKQIYNNFMHVCDILPTLATASGINLKRYHQSLDGVSQWHALKGDTISGVIRKSMLYNIDDVFGYSAYMENGMKVVEGTTLKGLYDDWMGDFIDPNEKLNSSIYLKIIRESKVDKVMSGKILLEDNEILEIQKSSQVDCSNGKKKENECYPLESPCLFNILEDPCEYFNLADKQPETLKQLLQKLNQYRKSAIPIRNKQPDFNANPLFHNNTWTFWQENIVNLVHEPIEPLPEYPILIILGISGIVLLIIFYSIINVQCTKPQDTQPITAITGISSIEDDSQENRNICNKNRNRDVELNMNNNNNNNPKNVTEETKIYL
uniref:CSON003318 protein n=1 Tax=Culicoides sonorensis TaxID=179676 RepID=A0A336LN14_CULSO